ELYGENYRKLMKEIEEDTKKWKNIPGSWIRRIHIIKISLLPKAIYTFNAIPIKIAPAFFSKLEQTVLKFVWNHKNWFILYSKMNLKNNRVGGLTFPNFKTTYKATAIKTLWYVHKDRHTNQWNGIESLEISPYAYGRLIFN
ncbi:LORF2 protein, partial [Crocuta crocuta]